MGVDVTRLCQAGKQDGRIEFKEKHSHRERSSTTTGTKRQENTYLKLQHVTFVVNDLNAQIVDVWWPRAIAAPVPHVPVDIDCHPWEGLLGVWDTVSVISWKVAPRNTCYGALLDEDRKESVVEH